MSEFLHMGGYAFYVWMSYGAALVVLALNLAAPILRHRRLVRAIPDRAPPTPPANPSPSPPS